MAEIFISPGIYTREHDFSYYVSSVNESHLAIIGEMPAGPAFRPVLISNIAAFKETFGALSTDHLSGYVAKNYFKYANKAWIVRVCGDDALRTATDKLVSIVGTTGSTNVLATLLVDPVASVTVLQEEAGTTEVISADTDMWLEISGGVYSGWVNLVNVNSPVYIQTLFPRDTVVSATSMSAALQMVFPKEAVGVTLESGATYAPTVPGDLYVVDGYTNAYSPMIVGETNGTDRGRSLFTVFTISDGLAANSAIKIEIGDIDATNRTFSLAVREFGDTNDHQVLLEKFTNLSMTKTDTHYIARAIGDNDDETVADYALVSKYIYVVVEDGDLTGALPWGFNDVFGSTTEVGELPAFAMNTAYTATVSVKRQSLGIDHEDTDLDLLMVGLGSERDLTTTGDTNILGFHLDSNAPAGFYVPGYTGIAGYTKYNAKFVVPIFGGTDGWLHSRGARNFLSVTPTTGETAQYLKAFDTIRSAEEFDINLLAVPGVAITNTIGGNAVDLVEERLDVFYVGDFPSGYTSALAASSISLPDSNYAATYWPYVKIFDEDTNQEVMIPPTPQVMEAIAYTDQVAYPWFAPAGMNRGLLTDVLRTKYKLTNDDRDILYNAKINPIATLPGQGYAIWGQKTLQTRQTSLDRINVRRMMLYIEKVIAGASQYLVFEQNDSKTWDRFKNMVQPILDRVKIKQGLYDFRVKMDETTNTPDMIDRGQLVGQIYVKPTKTAEVILINFNILATGASFDEGV